MKYKYKYDTIEEVSVYDRIRFSSGGNSSKIEIYFIWPKFVIEFSQRFSRLRISRSNISGFIFGGSSVDLELTGKLRSDKLSFVVSSSTINE